MWFGLPNLVETTLERVWSLSPEKPEIPVILASAGSPAPKSTLKF